MEHKNKQTFFLLSLVALLVVVGIINHYWVNRPETNLGNDYENHEKGLADLSNKEDNDETKEASGDNIDENDISEVGVVDSNDKKVKDIATETGNIIDDLILKEENRKRMNYYVEYRLSRDKLRASLMENLRFIIDNENSFEDMKKEAQEKILELVDLAGKELYIEKLIKSKGIEDALVFINDNSVSVVVEMAELTAVDVAKILNIVIEQTDLKAENINIMKRQ